MRRAGFFILSLGAAAACGRKEPAPAPQPAPEPPAAAAAPAAMIPDGGYEGLAPVVAELQAEAQADGESLSAHDVRSAFDSGFKEMDYRFLHNLTLEEAGLPPVPDLPGDSSEAGGLKCRKDGWVYLTAHPGWEEGYEECCRRKTKSKTTSTDMGGSVLLMTRPDGYADSWSCYRWQPRRRTWSAYGEEQLVDAFEFYAERNFGAFKQAEDQARAGALQGRARVLAAHHNRLKHEGAKYRVELERRRLKE